MGTMKSTNSTLSVVLGMIAAVALLLAGLAIGGHATTLAGLAMSQFG